MNAARFLKRQATSAGSAIREALKLESIRRVEAVLDEKSTNRKSARELERHGARIAMVVYMHGGAKDDEHIARFAGWVGDNMQWSQFLEQVTAATYGSKDVVKELSFTWLDDKGDVVLLSGTSGLRTWLDANWLRHPLEVHAYRAEMPPGNPQDDSAKVKECFAKYDTDGSGALSPIEMKAMLVEICANIKLEVSAREIEDWVSDQIAQADTNGDGTISFDEFEDYFRSLRDHLQKELVRDAGARVMRLRYDMTWHSMA